MRRRTLLTLAAAGVPGMWFVGCSPAKAATPRRLERVLPGTWSKDGAGVKLLRLLGSQALRMVDPFLLLDRFGSSDPADYLAGFPKHPHRGFETVTVLLDGTVDHQDSVGNRGSLQPGGLQWMTAGARHRARGDAQARRHRHQPRAAAVGEPARRAEVEPTPLPGRGRGRRPGGRARRRAGPRARRGLRRPRGPGVGRGDPPAAAGRDAGWGPVRGAGARGPHGAARGPGGRAGGGAGPGGAAGGLAGPDHAGGQGGCRRGWPVPPLCGGAARGAGGAARPVRDEHRRGAGTGLGGLEGGPAYGARGGPDRSPPTSSHRASAGRAPSPWPSGRGSGGSPGPAWRPALSRRCGPPAWEGPPTSAPVPRRTA
jgi:hypothetical protein